MMRFPYAHSPVLLASLAVLTLLLPNCVSAQIRTDSSLGKPAQSLAGPNYLIPQSLGKLAGNNLFHSFETFNINTGQSTTFTTATPGIVNVISRVTGGSLSQINGSLKLTAASGEPNFYFINPAGIAFGAGASIDVPGALHVSTADYVKFPEGNFHADATKASSFSTATPEAFGFLGVTRGSVNLTNGAALETHTFPTSIIAGDVTLDSATVKSHGGDISIVAIGKSTSKQEIGLTGILPNAAGELKVLNGSDVNSSGTGAVPGGNIQIIVGNATIDNSKIQSIAELGSTGNAGSLTVNATGALAILNGGEVLSHTASRGNAGNISITTGLLTIDGQQKTSNTGILSSAFDGTGNAGQITVAASGAMELLNGGEVSSASITSGNAGNVSIKAGSLSIDGGDNTEVTGIHTNSFIGTGISGNVSIEVAGEMELWRGAIINSGTGSEFGGAGKAGNISVKAGSLVIHGFWSGVSTGISSNADGGAGDAGQISINVAGEMLIAGRGTVVSRTYASGKAGNINIKAGSLTINGWDYTGSDWLTGVSSEAHSGTGDAGHIFIEVDGPVNIWNGGSVSSNTFTSGNAGNINIKVGALEIDSTDSGMTGVLSSTYSGTGDAGHISIEVAGAMSVLNGGSVKSNTSAQGKAGNISIKAGELSIDGQGFWAAIASEAWSNDENGFVSGDAGKISVDVLGAMNLLGGGQLSTGTLASGNAGDISVKANALTIDGKGTDSFTGIRSNTLGSTGNAGSISVDTVRTTRILNAGSIDTSSMFGGKAGSINVNTETLHVIGKGSQLNAETKYGNDGQTGSATIKASDSIVLAEGGLLSIRNSSTADSPTSMLPTALTVTAPNITLKNASITAASTDNVAASNIDINSAKLLYLDSSSITTSANQSNGGSIRIQGPGIVILDNSQITTSVAGFYGNGGDININAKALVMDTGFIQANTAAKTASGGSIGIDVELLVANGATLFVGGQTPYSFQQGVFGYNVIQAAAPTGASGNINLTSPVLDLSGTLTGLSARIIDTGGFGRSPCQMGGGSSLVQGGRGGFAPSARGLLGPALHSSGKIGEASSLRTDPRLGFAKKECTRG